MTCLKRHCASYCNEKRTYGLKEGVKIYKRELYEKQVIGLPEDITKVPQFDPTKCYNAGDFVRGNTELTSYTLYKVMSSSCQITTGTYGQPDYSCRVDLSSSVYTVSNTGRILELVVGKRYYVNDIITFIDSDNKSVYYLVKVEFVLTNWNIDIVNTEKICTLLLKIKTFKKFTFFAEKLFLLYMQLGIGLYPDLMPVQRYGETQNNRPIYEPWLIWGFYKFLWNKRTNDWGDDEIPPLFDLSPSFA